MPEVPVHAVGTRSISLYSTVQTPYPMGSAQMAVKEGHTRNKHSILVAAMHKEAERLHSGVRIPAENVMGTCLHADGDRQYQQMSSTDTERLVAASLWYSLIA